MRDIASRLCAALLLVLTTLLAVTAARASRAPALDAPFDDAFFDDGADPFALIGDFGPAPEVKTRVRDEGDRIVLSFEIPGLDAASVKFDVARGRVRLSYDARSVQEKSDAKGRVVFRGESSAHYETAVLVPPEADADRFRTEKKGDSIRLIFERRPSRWRS